MPFSLFKSYGVLGMNARNLKYIRPFNPKRAVAFADNKLKTKIFLETRGVPVPKLFFKITSRRELRLFDFSKLPDACVLKPNFGYGGEGIVVLRGRGKGGFRSDSARHISYDELIEHIEDVLDGMYSLNHRRDTAFFEQLIFPHECFSPLGPVGLPDIRIIVFNLVPVMAMLRLPTRESGGRANLHMGGVGLGIDIAKGTTTFAVQRSRRIGKLPNGRSPGGFKIPQWDEMLLIASRIQQITNIGFLGVDLTIDAEGGPLLLEVNARAGLAVQLANLAPLGKRLERVEGLKVSSPEKGVRMAQDLFGEKIVAKEGSSKGKTVLATREPIDILGGEKTVTVPAILRPDHERTVVDPSLLADLESIGAIERTEDGTSRMKFLLGGKKLQTVVHPHVIGEEGVHVSIGKRDLSDFLVDPSKPSPLIPIKAAVDLRRIDRQLAEIDRRLQLLRHIRPINVEAEWKRALEDPSFNPLFVYGELRFDPLELHERLQYLRADDSPLGQLLEKKRKELMKKITLLQARGNNERFTEASVELFGSATPELVSAAGRVIRERKTPHRSSRQKKAMLTAKEVQSHFTEVLRTYGLRDWEVVLREGAIADCSLGRKTIILRADATFSRERTEGLVAHEIETHVLTSENAERQPYEVFQRCAGYLETQEGLAVINQNRFLPEDHEKRYWPALGALAVHHGRTHSFADLRASIRRHGFDDSRALRTCLKVKRGMGNTALPGVFTKELLYFRGGQVVRKFLDEGGDIRELYIGKIALQDLPLVHQVKGVIDPVYMPKFILV